MRLSWQLYIEWTRKYPICESLSLKSMEFGQMLLMVNKIFSFYQVYEMFTFICLWYLKMLKLVLLVYFKNKNKGTLTQNHYITSHSMLM